MNKERYKGMVIGFILCLLLSTGVLTAASAIGSATFNNTAVIFNGEALDLPLPLISVVPEGETNVSNYMPVRGVLEAMGYTVDWDGANNAILVTNQAQAQTPVATPEPVIATSGNVSFGDTFVFEEMEITFNRPYGFVTINNRFSRDDGADVIKIPVTIRNVSDSSQGLSSFWFTQFGSEGIQSSSSIRAYFDNDIASGQLQPGATRTAYMYMLYDGDGDYVIEFSRFRTDTVIVRLPIVKP